MIDERAIPPAGRIGETEDLIGSVFVKDGKVCGSHPFAAFKSKRGADDRWSRRHMMPNLLTDSSRVMVR